MTKPSKKSYTENHYGTFTREEIDSRPLERALKRTGRKHRTSPVTMLKIVLYAAMERSYSSRPIEEACKRDINYSWLLNGEPAPSSLTICRFHSELLSECGEKLFYGLAKRLKEVGEIRYEHLFVDGTKIEANVNKYSFVWQKSTRKYESRVLSRLEKAVPTLCEQYGVWPQNEEALLAQLRARWARWYTGGGKRKSQIQRDVEYLEGLLSRKAKYTPCQEDLSWPPQLFQDGQGRRVTFHKRSGLRRFFISSQSLFRLSKK